MMPIAVDQRSLIVSVYTTVWRSKHNQTSELEWACWWARQPSWFPYYRLLEFLDYNLDRSQAPTQLSINCLQYKRWKILGGRLGETLLLDDGAMTVHNGGRTARGKKTRQGDYQYSSCLWPKKSVYILAYHDSDVKKSALFQNCRLYRAITVKGHRHCSHWVQQRTKTTYKIICVKSGQRRASHTLFHLTHVGHWDHQVCKLASHFALALAVAFIVMSRL